jgi:hypothetical protein
LPLIGLPLRLNVRVSEWADIPKAIDFIASGLALAMNPDSSPVEHLARMGFEICSPENINPARQTVATSEEHPVFLEDFATPCQFIWLARRGVWWL